jgi:hypothetical protein
MTTAIEPDIYTKKPFDVEAYRITDENMEKLAAWCSGIVKTNREGKKYIHLDIPYARNIRQTMGFKGDWVVLTGTSFKLYTNKAFLENFDRKKKNPS